MNKSDYETNHYFMKSRSCFLRGSFDYQEEDEKMIPGLTVLVD